MRLTQDSGDLTSLTIVAIDPNSDNLIHAKDRLVASPASGKFDLRVQTHQGLIEDLTESDLRSFTADLPAVRIINSATRCITPCMEPGTRRDVDRSCGWWQVHGSRCCLRWWNRTLITTRKTFPSGFTSAGNTLEPRSRWSMKHRLIRAKFLIKSSFWSEIRDIFGVSDTFRCERHEPIDTWLLRLTKAGLQPLSLHFERTDIPSCVLHLGAKRRTGSARIQRASLIAVYAYGTPMQKDGSR